MSHENDDHPAGVHRAPHRLFRDAIERALGWVSEDELRALVRRYTGVQMSLGDANHFSQEVAALILCALREPNAKKTDSRETFEACTHPPGSRECPICTLPDDDETSDQAVAARALKTRKYS
jgi:hypothetical protein